MAKEIEKAIGAPRVDHAAKGRCYEVTFTRFVFESLPLPFILCHGTPVEKRPPYSKMGHAWLETEIQGRFYVWDAIYPEALIPRENYYNAGKIEPAEVQRYTKQEAMILANDTGHYGPWDKTIDQAAHNGD